MEHEADVNFQMNNGITSIYVACQKNHLVVVKMLLTYKADLNRCEENGWSPLLAVSNFNHNALVEYLCNHSDAFANISNKEGETPLYILLVKMIM